MIRVVHVVQSFGVGGLETLVGAMAAEFAESDVKMSVVVLNGSPGRMAQRVTPVLEAFRVLRPTPLVSMIWPKALIDELQSLQADVVHVHSGCWFKGARAAKLAGVRRVIFTEHGREHADPLVGRLIDRVAARQTDVVVAVSERLAEYLVRKIGVPRRRVRTIQNGVDTKRFCPGHRSPSLRAGLGIPDAALVVGSVGRLEPVKAYEFLIEAIAEIPATLGPVHLVLCGDGSERTRLEERAASRGVAVHFPGWIDDAAAYYRSFDVFALTSTSEGLSVSLLEAMASGCVPVVTDVGANKLVLGSELEQQLVIERDVSVFARTLARTLSSRSEMMRLGSVARERVCARFSLAEMADSYRQIYLGKE